MTLKFKYYGHATFGVEADGVRLVIDPFLSPNNPAAAVSADQVAADYILLTHGHGDHCADVVALAKRTGATVISNFEIMTWLQGQGVQNCHAMNTGGAYGFPFGRVKMTIAHHSSTLPDNSPGGNPAGYLIHFNDGSDVYFAGDTALTYDMKLIGEAGGVDLAVLPIGDNYTMGPDDAVVAAQFAQAKRVIPCHFNTFPVIAQDAQSFAKKLRSVGIEGVVLQPGEEFTL